LQREETGGLVIAEVDDVQRRLLVGAPLLRLEASGPEAAARGRVDRRGNVSLEDQPLALALDLWIRNRYRG
jgi:hypothetical protein